MKNKHPILADIFPEIYSEPETVPRTLAELKRKHPDKSIDELCPDVARMESKTPSKGATKANKPPRWISELLNEFPEIEIDDPNAVDRIRSVWSWCIWKLKEHGGHYMGRRYVPDEKLLLRQVLNTTFHASAGKPDPVNATQLANTLEDTWGKICSGDISFLQGIEKRQHKIKTYEKGVIQIEEIRKLAAAAPKGFIPRRRAADLLGVSVPTIKLYEIPKKSKLGLTLNLEAISGPNGRVKYRHDNLKEFAESRLPKIY